MTIEVKIRLVMVEQNSLQQQGPLVPINLFWGIHKLHELYRFWWMWCCLIKVMPHCGQLAEYSRLVGHFIWYRMYSIQVVPGPCSSSMSTLLTKHANLFGHPFDQLGRLDLYRNRIADTGVGRLAEAGFANHDLLLDLLTWFHMFSWWVRVDWNRQCLNVAIWIGVRPSLEWNGHEMPQHWKFELWRLWYEFSC